MKRKVVFGIMLTLLLIGMLTLAFNVHPAKAIGTIYIRPDGTVDPPTAPIQREGDLYTLTDNIASDSSGIVVERDNIVVDGAGYTLLGPATWDNSGIWASGRTNVTIRNMEIEAFQYGIHLRDSLNNSIINNTIANNSNGIWLLRAERNKISENNITANYWKGIMLEGDDANFNNIVGNNITANNEYGIELYRSRGNNITGNYITANYWAGILIRRDSSSNIISGNTLTENIEYGIRIAYSSNNKFYHNNFITDFVYIEHGDNVWDDSYPSGGNYWSYYVGIDLYSGPHQNETGSDGIGDIPYTFFGQTDRYPLMNPWTPTPPVITATIDIDPDTLNLKSKGQWITAYIQLPEGYNPEDIDATTILLNETIQPVLDPKYDFVTNSSEYLVDHNEDGILERMVKFDRAEVMALLSVGEATLTITGEVNGTPFEGSDTIRVIDE